MPRTKSKNQTTDKTQPNTPSFDPTQLPEWVRRIENLNAEIDNERAAFQNVCSGIRDEIKDVIGEAKRKGVPVEELKTVIKARGLEKRVAKLRADLEDEISRDTYDDMLRALGGLAELPLGQAAAARHPDHAPA